MIEQETYVFEDRTHELHTKSGFFFNVSLMIHIQCFMASSICSSRVLCNLSMPLFRSSRPEVFCKKKVFLEILQNS